MNPVNIEALSLLDCRPSGLGEKEERDKEIDPVTHKAEWAHDLDSEKKRI
jgi:hypothetical protein